MKETRQYKGKYKPNGRRSVHPVCPLTKLSVSTASYGRYGCRCDACKEFLNKRCIEISLKSKIKRHERGLKPNKGIPYNLGKRDNFVNMVIQGIIKFET